MPARRDTGADRATTRPRPASGRAGSLNLALWVLAVCALLLGLMHLSLGPVVPDARWAVELFTVVSWIWAAAGIVAWWRRPRNATGALIFIGGLCVSVASLGNTDVGQIAVLGTVFATAVLAVTVHLLHAFPSGRLRSRASIATVVAGYVVALVFQAPLYLIPAEQQPDLWSAAVATQQVLGIGVMVATAIILVDRLRRADPAYRRVLLPLYLYGSLVVLVIPVIPLVVRALELPGEVSGGTQLVLIAGLPVAFLLGVLLGGFSRTAELEALSAWLGTSGAERPAVAKALARTLGDDSLRVVYWAAEREVFVDEDGDGVDSTQFGHDRRWAEVRVQSRLVGAIVYDPRIIDDEGSVHRAGAILAIAVDRERLTTELLASNRALSRSRLRLVETADRERSRIARDLHDGLQVQLVLLALEAQQIGDAPEASAATGAASEELRRRIDEAAADLRRLVHNVLPAALVEQGLSAATEDLVDRLAIPATLELQLGDEPVSPAVTRTAYLIVAEALTNAVKHSRASRVHVRLRRSDDRLHVEVVDDGIGGAGVDAGTGLRGLTDRVDVIGGTVTIESPRGAGTRVRAELPCES